MQVHLDLLTKGNHHKRWRSSEVVKRSEESRHRQEASAMMTNHMKINKRECTKHKDMVMYLLPQDLSGKVPYTCCIHI